MPAEEGNTICSIWTQLGRILTNCRSVRFSQFTKQTKSSQAYTPEELVARESVGLFDEVIALSLSVGADVLLAFVLHLLDLVCFGLASDWIGVLFHKRKKLLTHFANDAITKLHNTCAATRYCDRAK